MSALAEYARVSVEQPTNNFIQAKLIYYLTFIILQMQGLSSVGHRPIHQYVTSFGIDSV